jgi:hypothetical protein
MSELPDRLQVGAEKGALFVRRPGLYSVRQPADAAAPGALLVIPADASASYAIYEGDTAGRAADQEPGPVYAAGPSGPLAVPTGRVLVRLSPQLRPEQRRDEFANAGFQIERVLPYAPHAAWLQPTTGGVETALRGLEALARIPGTEHVEPQMLLERRSRD